MAGGTRKLVKKLALELLPVLVLVLYTSGELGDTPGYTTNTRQG